MAAFNLDKSSEGVYYIVFDTPDKKVNVLDMTVMDELSQILKQIMQDENAKGVIFISGKKNIFIAGADISVIKNIKNKQDGVNLSKKGREILRHIENLNIPSIAAINGACLGGGMELALFCSYRIGTDNPSTKFGLPEVSLGVLPGFGGTQLLPKLIGIRSAIAMIISGKKFDSKRAQKIGLIDKMVPETLLKENAEQFLNYVLTPKGKMEIEKKRKAKKNFFLEGNFIGQSLIFREAHKQILNKTGGNYPAPVSALSAIKGGFSLSPEAALDMESEMFGAMAITPVCKNLIDVYYWSEKAKKAGKKENIKAIAKAGVLGAGVMGGGIAQLISAKKLDVRMKDIKKEAILAGFASAWKVYQGAIERKKITKDEAEKNMLYISPALDYTGFGKLDIVIEAVVEDMEIKKKVFQELEGNISPDTIIASNTSSISISKMASVLKHPERFIGLHFFNPVHLMPLIEIIPGDKTDEKTLNTVIDFAISLGKMPVVVKDREGFLVNRILMPYLNEAGKLLNEGVSIEMIDRCAKKFGMPMGPLELMDEIGIDVGHKVALIMESAFGKRMQVSNILNKIYEDKRFGKKVKKGFYIHTGKTKIPDQKYIDKIRQNTIVQAMDEEEVLSRILMIMINESALCLEENIAASAGELDFALIMGIGFPAFRGGVLKFADTIGSEKIYKQLKDFEQKYGVSFAPSEKLKLMSLKNEAFYL
ncbi:enoyl-CoA hydratase/isomerase family protein [Candidatus Desantisbacteria bacterium]|nr:enoyl-CoA hydratase/isomerase family protein [Candidatus Desantisbacteria bacterium]